MCHVVDVHLIVGTHGNIIVQPQNAALCHSPTSADQSKRNPPAIQYPQHHRPRNPRFPAGLHLTLPSNNALACSRILLDRSSGTPI